MPFIQWSDKFAIGVEQVDAQHKRLFELAGALYILAHGEDSGPALGDSLNELVEYTRYHFQSEEALMLEYGYHRLDAHKLEHDALARQALDFRTRFARGEAVSVDEFLGFVYAWLTRHIMDQDKKVGAYIELERLKPGRKD